MTFGACRTASKEQVQANARIIAAISNSMLRGIRETASWVIVT
jgi:hypothetical protein